MGRDKIVLWRKGKPYNCLLEEMMWHRTALGGLPRTYINQSQQRVLKHPRKLAEEQHLTYTKQECGVPQPLSTIWCTYRVHYSFIYYFPCPVKRVVRFKTSGKMPPMRTNFISIPLDLRDYCFHLILSPGCDWKNKNNNTVFINISGGCYELKPRDYYST